MERGSFRKVDSALSAFCGGVRDSGKSDGCLGLRAAWKRQIWGLNVVWDFVIYLVKMKSSALVISLCVALHYVLTLVSFGDDQISNLLHLSTRVLIGVK